MLEACSPFQTQKEFISSSSFLTSRSYSHPLACSFHFQSDGLSPPPPEHPHHGVIFSNSLALLYDIWRPYDYTGDNQTIQERFSTLKSTGCKPWFHLLPSPPLLLCRVFHFQVPGIWTQVDIEKPIFFPTKLAVKAYVAVKDDVNWHC